MYLDGKGVEKNIDQAVNWIQQAAEQGHAEAQYDLAHIYLDGKGVEKNNERVVDLFREAAFQGHAKAQEDLYDLMKARDENSSEDISLEDLNSIEELAKNGDAEAQYELSQMYLKVKGVNQSDARAAKWLEKAAEQGHAEAQYQLYKFYKNRVGGVPWQNEKTALYWLQEAVQQSHEDARSQLTRTFGKDVRPDQNANQVFDLIQKAFLQDADAQYDLGQMYLKGKRLYQSDSKAFDWVNKAAWQGHAEAQYVLSQMYRKGKGIYQNNTKADEWLEKAAEQGHAEAQYDLAQDRNIDQFFDFY